MSRTTVTVADFRGVKVRTALGKKYFIVIPNGADRAKVITRTNSSVAALRAVKRWGENARIWAVVRGTDEVRTLPVGNLSYIANQEKREIKAAKTHGYKHEAF